MKNTKGQILIVDDEVHIATAFARLLSKEGYDTLVAQSGKEALELAQQYKPQLIICDVILPDISGVEVLSNIKSNPRTKSSFVVLISSQNIDSYHQAEGFEKGADGYLLKPIQNRELVARVDAYMRHINTIDKLRQSEDSFRKIVEGSVNAIIIVDSESRIQFANPTACRLFEKPAVELVGFEFNFKGKTGETSEVEITLNQQNHTFEQQANDIVWDHMPMTLITLHDQTDRIAHIKKIDEQNKRYARAQAMGKVGNWEFTYSNKDLWVSDEVKRLLGLSWRDYLDFDIRHKRDILDERVFNTLRDLIERQENFNFVFEIKPVNQSQSKTLITKAEIEVDSEGKPYKLVGVVLDITERKMAEEAIRASELNFRTIFNSTNEAIFISDTKGYILDVNQRVLEIYGFDTKDEILHKTLHTINANEPPYTPQLAELHIKQALSQGFQTFEWLAKKKNGEHFWVEVSLSSVDLNKEKRVISVVRDISTRKKSEQEFQRLNKEISAIFKASKPLQYLNTPEKLAYEIIHVLEDILHYEHCAVLLKDEDGLTLKPFAISDQGKGNDFIEIDKNYIESKDLKIGKGIVGWVVENGQSVLINDVTKDERYFSLRHDILSEVCVPIISDSIVIGAINIETTLPNAYAEADLKILETMSAQIGIAIQNANLYQQIQVELAERKLVEERVNKLNEELEAKVEDRTHALEGQLDKLHKSQRAMLYMVEDLNEMTEELKRERQKLEFTNLELESFSYSVSHDLRAPLRAIDGFSKILVDDYSSVLDEEATRLLNIVRSNSQKMDRLIIDLLALSRVTRGNLKLVPTEMALLVSNVYKDIFEPTITRKLKFEVLPLPNTKVDPTLIKQVWQNLIDNAIKYSKPNQDINIEVGGKIEDNRCVYYIKDNGIGLDTKYSQKVFETFQRLHRPEDYEGTGIGLSVVQRIVIRHGGSVWAEGTPGEGATFWFALPLQTD